MNRKERIQKTNDQEETDKAFDYIQTLVKSHPEIEPSLWTGACFSSVAAAFANNNIPYEFFVNEVDRMKIHYKSWFENE